MFTPNELRQLTRIKQLETNLHYVRAQWFTIGLMLGVLAGAALILLLISNH